MSIKYFFLPLLLNLGSTVYAIENLSIPDAQIYTLNDTSWNNLIGRSVDFYKEGNLATSTSKEFMQYYFTADQRTTIVKSGFKYALYEEILRKYYRTWLEESYSKLTYSQEIYINIPSFKNNLIKAFKENEQYQIVKPFVDIILEQCIMSLNHLGDKPVSLHIILEGFRAYLNAGMYTLKEQETFNALKKSFPKADANTLYNIVSTTFNPFEKAMQESLTFAQSVDDIVIFRTNYLDKSAEKAMKKWEETFFSNVSISTIGVDIESFLAAVRALHDSSKNDLEKKYYALFKERIFSTVINTLRPNSWSYNLKFYKELFYKNIHELLNTPYFLLALEKNKGKENEVAQNIENITTTLLETLEKNTFNLQTEQYQFAKVLAMEDEKFNLSFVVNIRSIKNESDKITYSIINLIFNEKTLKYKDKTYKISVNFQPKLEDNSGIIYYQFLESDRVIGTLPLAYKISTNQNFNINFNIQIDENNILYKEQVANNNIFKDLLENILFL